MTRALSTRRWLRLLAVLLGFTLIVAACGGDDDSSEGTGGEDEAPTDSEPDESDVGDPVAGGKITYGLEADTDNPWTPQGSTCAVSCHMVMRAVYDPLTMYNEDLDVEPNLLESFEPNEDYTQWTLTPREGITFHDGTPFNAEAIVANLKAHQTSFLTARALLNMESVELSADGTAAVVTAKAPWVSFPSGLAGQLGYMASPTWLAAIDAGTAQQTAPVGTGPFVYKSYEAGNNFVATKNPDYWREGLPYLDEIEFRFLPDVEARKNALVDGQIDMLHTSNGATIKELRDVDSIELSETTAYGETNFTLLNNGNPDSHISDVRVRRALAMALDNELLIERRGGGLGQEANGPFSPDQLGYLEDSGYPTYDPDGARALVEEYKAEKGLSELTLSYTTATDPANLATAELVQQMWQAVGFTIEIAQIEQGDFIVQALLGNFEMFGWRNHGGIDPANQRIWWHSETAQPIGELALNFGRIQDPVIDENLDILRASTDEGERKEAAETINRQFAEQVYNLWSSWTIWGIAKAPNINGLDDFILPSGANDIYGSGFAGTHQLAQLWIGE